MDRENFETKYGYFDIDGSYVIKTPFTPKPWVNVISNGKYGMIVSQTGGGFSWYIHSEFNRLTRWFQDLVKDDWGKYFYIKDNDTGKYWSTAFQPTKVKFDSYRVRHGFGYSTIETKKNGIKTETTVFVPMDYSLEVWKIKISNLGSKKRNLSLFSYLEWALGVSPDNAREFHKIFIDTEYKNDVLIATKRLWSLKNKKGQHNNRSWEYIAYNFCNKKPVNFDTDKENFVGKYGDLINPAALNNKRLKKSLGKWNDSISSMQINVSLQPKQEKEIIFVLGLDKKESNIYKIKKYFSNLKNVEKEFEKVNEHWTDIFNRLYVDTPDKSINLYVNKWLKYQAISCRVWGRSAYYQQGGAYGFRDQLQDSQIFLPINSDTTKAQIKLHAEHQFSDGIVYHWWHPITEEGLRNDITDNLLWLPFLTYRYLIETNDFKFLSEVIKYKDKGSDTLYRHCIKTFEVVMKRMSKRFLPLIGAGDWNDGLNAVGTEWKGESIWLGFFLYYILDRWEYIFKQKKDKKNLDKYRKIKERLGKSLNKYGWDGKWFLRATKDNGEKIGSKVNKQGKIFLNAQTWSVLSGAGRDEYKKQAMNSVKRYLDRNNGSLLFYPAYSIPDEEIGYLTRYAPGVRENGGVYFHAATWSLWARLEMSENEYAYELYKKMSPILSGMDPDRYMAEPYVTPGNIDGVDSPLYGRGGWTWYTGSAAWLFTILVNELLGIKPDWKGLKIEPKIPSSWNDVTIKRKFRGVYYNIRIINKGSAKKISKIIVDGKEIEGNIIVPDNKRKNYKVEVYLK